MATGTQTDSGTILVRLHRIEGQVRGLTRMIDEEACCIDVVTQMAAVSRALQSVAILLLDEHLHRCVTEALQAGGPVPEDKVREAMAAVSRLVHCH